MCLLASKAECMLLHKFHRSSMQWLSRLDNFDLCRFAFIVVTNLHSCYLSASRCVQKHANCAHLCTTHCYLTMHTGAHLQKTKHHKPVIMHSQYYNRKLWTHHHLYQQREGKWSCLLSFSNGEQRVRIIVDDSSRNAWNAPDGHHAPLHKSFMKSHSDVWSLLLKHEQTECERAGWEWAKRGTWNAYICSYDAFVPPRFFRFVLRSRQSCELEVCSHLALHLDATTRVPTTLCQIEQSRARFLFCSRTTDKAHKWQNEAPQTSHNAFMTHLYCLECNHVGYRWRQEDFK